MNEGKWNYLSSVIIMIMTDLTESLLKLMNMIMGTGKKR